MGYSINKENAVWRIVDGEAAIVNLSSTFYYGLNRTGTFIWQLLNDQELGFDELVERVSAQYHEPAAGIAEDIKDVIQELKAENLIVER